MTTIDNRKKLSVTDELNIIHDLAVTPLSQKQIAQKYGVTPARISQFKSEHQEAVDTLVRENYEKATGDFIRSQEFRFREYEKDLLKLDNKRSPEFVKVRAQILKQVAEEMGQIAPRTQIAIIPAQHVIVGIDVENDL